MSRGGLKAASGGAAPMPGEAEPERWAQPGPGDCGHSSVTEQRGLRATLWAVAGRRLTRWRWGRLCRERGIHRQLLSLCLPNSVALRTTPPSPSCVPAPKGRPRPPPPWMAGTFSYLGVLPPAAAPQSSSQHGGHGDTSPLKSGPVTPPLITLQGLPVPSRCRPTPFSRRRCSA